MRALAAASGGPALVNTPFYELTALFLARWLPQGTSDLDCPLHHLQKER